MPTWSFKDLDKISESKNLKVNIATADTPEEIAFKLSREESDAKYHRIKDLILFIAVLLGVSVIVYVCLNTAINNSTTPDDKKWATSILTAIVSGGVGYLTGKRS
jgi:hypothetical protein